MVGFGEKLELRGPMAELYDLPFLDSKGERVVEIMFDSSRGTGKTVGDSANLVEWCLDFPGSRFMVARMALSNLRSTWEVTFREIVLPSYGIDPSIVERRSEHQYVIGESLIQLRGLDDPQKARSFECNASFFIEGNEIPESTYEDLRGALRWASGIPAHFSFIECNPDSPAHWAYKRFGLSPGCGSVWTPGRVRMQPQHKDNPAYYDAQAGDWTALGASYRHNLRTSMSGVRYRRLFLGEWALSEGAIFDNWDEHKHVLDGYLEKRKSRWFIVPNVAGAFEEIELLWFAAGQDWGFENPGVVSVWGFDKDLRSYMVEEVYHSHRSEDWWAGQIQELHEKFDLWRVVSDPENASGIAKVNAQLRARDGQPLLRKASKGTTGKGRTKFAQIMHMHTRFEGEVPMSRVLRSTLNHTPDPDLAKRTQKTLDEWGSYQWKPPTASAQEMPTDEPLKKNDHGIEAALYLHWWTHGKDFRMPPEVKKSRPGSFGELMGYDEEMEQSEGWVG